MAVSQSSVVVTEHVSAELVVHAPEGIASGNTIWLGLHIRHHPHWHTYWKNPGDSGLPTTLNWLLPAGFSVGDIYWPLPKQLPVGPLLNYGYEGDLLLPVPLTVPKGFSGAALPISLRADWLVCNEICLPESGEFALEVPTTAITEHAALFSLALDAQPHTPAGMTATATLTTNALHIEVDGLPAAFKEKSLLVFPEEAGVFEHAAPVTQQWDGEQLRVQLPLSTQRSESPTAMHIVISEGQQLPAIRIGFEINDRWPQPGASVTSNAARVVDALPLPSVNTAAENDTSWLMSLVFAFIGGVILNLMPCVFPVLSLKVLSFAQYGGERKTAVTGGLAYTVGVVISFLLLATLLLVLSSSGELLGWGFQLQSPLFVTGLTILFTLIGLNLAGLFEFNNILPDRIAILRAQNPVSDEFLSGVLAVAIASPCTAPFMGVALGAALTQPAPFALAVFASLGFGMATPYLIASLFPGVARCMPRPGLWMVRFKTVMAFPMFATVVWLVWVLGQQVGIHGVAAVLGILVALTFAVWATGLPASGKIARWSWKITALSILLLVSIWAWPALQPLQNTGNEMGGGTTDPWQRWSPQITQRAREDGRPIFVDFTAAWCVTCQYNKRTTLSDAMLLKELQAKNVLLLRADWTLRDETITTELKRLGRSGVPVYALYVPHAEQPKLLSELLSVAEIREALKLL